MNKKIKIIIIFLSVIVIFAIGFYVFKKSEIQKAQVITNDKQDVETAEVATDELVSSDIAVEDAPNNATTEQSESAVIEKTPTISAEESVTPAKGSEPDAQKEDSKLNPENSPKTVVKLFTSGFQVADGRKIDTIIIHSSYNALGGDQYNVSAITDIYKSYGVSAHYLIDRDGTIYQLVREKDIAYHAGVSSVPDGRTGVNAFSVGIELVNTKTDKFTAAQYNALNDLINELKSRYNIKYVLGHNQIAPERKDDPWNFDWSKI